MGGSLILAQSVCHLNNVHVFQQYPISKTIFLQSRPLRQKKRVISVLTTECFFTKRTCLPDTRTRRYIFVFFLRASSRIRFSRPFFARNSIYTVFCSSATPECWSRFGHYPFFFSTLGIPILSIYLPCKSSLQLRFTNQRSWTLVLASDKVYQSSH